MGSSRSKLTAETNAAPYDLTGKTILITGANAGLGLETSRVLAERGARVVMLARDQTKNESAIIELQSKQINKIGSFVPMQLDLTSLASIKSFCDEYRKTGFPIHILICNAGVMATEYKQTVDGIDLQFGTNHVGHFYLFQQLLPVLQSTATTSPVRVIALSSKAHTMFSTSPINYSRLPFTPKKQYSPWRAYQQSKYANVLFAYELNRRYSSQGITGYSLHPGVIATNLSGHMGVGGSLFRGFANVFSKNVPQGAATTVYCALTPGLESSGGHYFDDSTLQEAVVAKFRDGEGRELWEWTDKIIAEKTGVLASTPASTEVTQQGV